MEIINLTSTADTIVETWKSKIIGRVGTAQVKVLRMDGRAYPEEQHDYVEGLMVLEGCLKLCVQGNRIDVRSGEIYFVPVGIAHSVEPGSEGTLVIIDS
jgi:mannose-6-phosphate isomerase-like protein (cupin superfamily)